MLSDEEKKAIDNMKSLLLYSKEHEYFSPFQEQEIDDMNIVLNLIEKQQKEIEELKDDRKKYAEEYIHNNPWLYKQLNENYILRVESEQRERGEYIKGTNDADELCNKKWLKKIKALMEKEDKLFFETKDVRHANRYKAYKELIEEE